MNTVKFLSATFITMSFILVFNLKNTRIDKLEKKEVLTLEEFSEQDLVAYLKELNVKYPHIVLAQAKLETGNFTSLIFKQNNNLFGMKQAKSRATTCKGTFFNHAIYNSWKDSVLDYALYSSKHLNKVSSEEQYIAYLGEHYAQDPNYSSKLKKIIEKENLKTLFL